MDWVDDATIESEELEPIWMERAFEVLPGSAAPALGLEAHLASVGAVAGANDVDVLGASVLTTGLLLTRPAAWLHWHRFSRLEEMRPAWSHLASLGHSALEEPQSRVDLGRLSALQALLDRQAATGLSWTALATVATVCVAMRAARSETAIVVSFLL